MNNSPINSTINSTTVVELADASSLSANSSNELTHISNRLVSRDEKQSLVVQS